MANESKTNLLHINSENFDSEVINSNVPVFVQFSADWCGPCKMLSPIVEALHTENDSNTVKIVKINVDANAEIAKQYSVRGIPCVIALRDGLEVAGSRLVGVRAKSEYQSLIDSL